MGYAEETKKSHELASAFAAEAVSNIRTVVSFTMEEGVKKRLREMLEEPMKAAGKRCTQAGILNGFGGLLSSAGFAVSMFYMQYALKTHKIQFPTAFTVFQIISGTALHLSELFSILPAFARVAKGFNSVFSTLNRETKIDSDEPGAKKPKNISGFIEFQSIQFRYPSRPEVLVLNDLSLKIKAGKTVALVGESGSGKSSLISLVERFYDPTSGKVLIDGTDIRELNLKWLRQRIGLVQQEPVLFNTNIKRNILYGNEDATEAEIIEAAKAANAHKFISGLPQGYRSEVGDRGSQLSGGQKQRIAIARAILKNPPILLLDEATSALDNESEKIVQDALDRLVAGGSRTTLVVAHRLSTIQNADVIVVMSSGRIVEQGDHRSLLSRGGLYSRLVASHQRQKK